MNALLLLWVWTVRNHVRALRRQHPATQALLLLVGAAIVFTLSVFLFAVPGVSADVWWGRPLVLGLVSLGTLQLTLGAWLFPARTGLAFSPGEVNFLFPAPLGRATLLGSRVLAFQLPLLLLALVCAKFLPLRPGDSRLVAWLGVHLALTFLHLNRLAGCLASVPRVDTGRPGPLRPLVGGLLAGGLGWLVWTFPADELWAGVALEDLLGGSHELALRRASECVASWAGHGLPGLVLAPFRALGELVASPGPGGEAVLPRLLPALLAVLPAYLYVVHGRGQFMEAALQASEVLRLRLEQFRTLGKWNDPTGAGIAPPPLPLELWRDPVWGLVWKNLAGITRVSLPRYALGASGLVGLAWLAIWTPQVRPYCFAACMVAYGGVGMTLLMVGEAGHLDLRAALKRPAWLKTVPLPGWRLFLGEVLASALASWAVASLFLVLAAILADPVPQAPPASWRAPAALAGVLALFPVIAFLVVFTNAAAVALPRLFGAFPPRTVLDVLGLYLLMFLRTVALSLALGPPALAALLVGGVGWALVGPVAFPVGALALGLVLLAETALLVAGAGRLLDAHEPAPV